MRRKSQVKFEDLTPSSKQAVIAMTGMRGMERIGKAVIAIDNSLAGEFEKSSDDEKAAALESVCQVANQAFKDKGMGIRILPDPSG